MLVVPCDTTRSHHRVWRVCVLPMFVMQPRPFMADAGTGSCATPPSRFAAPRPYLRITSRSRVLRIYTAPQALLCGAVLCHGNHARIRTEPTRRLGTRIGCGPFANHDDAPPTRSTPEA